MGSISGVSFGFPSSLLPRRKTWIFAGCGRVGLVFLPGSGSAFLGSWAGGPGAGLATLPPRPPDPDLSATGRCELVPKKPSVVAGYSHTPLPTPALARGPPLLRGARGLKLAEISRATRAAFFKWRNLAFPSFVADFSHLKRALRHFKPVNGRALCAARWHLEP